MVTLTRDCGFPKEARSRMDIFGIIQPYYAGSQLDISEIPHVAVAISVRGDKC
jgi:hypothetical protein